MDQERKERILQQSRLQEQEGVNSSPVQTVDPERAARILQKAQAKKPPEELQTPENLSFVEKVAAAREERMGQMTDTFESMASMPSNPNNPVPANAISTTEGITQLMGSGVGFAFDVAGAGISEVAEKAWSVLPDSFTSALSDTARDFVTELANSDVGKAGLSAMAAGGEALEAFQEQYPQEYKTLASALTVGAASNRLVRPNPQLNVVRLAPPKSGKVTLEVGPREKDVFSVIMDTSKKAREEATKNTTGAGVLGRQERIMTPSEERMVEAVKKVKGVSSAETMQTNLNLINKRVNDLGKGIEGRLKTAQGSVDVSTLQSTLSQKINQAIQDNPNTYGLGNPGKMRAALKQAESMSYQAFRYVDEYGTDALGLHKARQAFDKYYQKLAQRAFDSGSRMPAAIEDSYKMIRESLNEAVDQLSPGTKDIRLEQSNLLSAASNITPKAASEAGTALGRMYQAIGIGEARTPFAIAANLPFNAAIIALSPLYFAGKQFKRYWKAAPVQTARGRAQHTLKQLRTDFAKELSKIKDPAARKQGNIDLKIITSVINSLNQGEEDAGM